MTIYFTSDFHFGHENIIRLVGRPFSNLEEMHGSLIRSVNARVGENDELYVLGDFSFKLKQAQAWAIRDEIKCKNVHLVCGNHDCGWVGTDAFKSVSDYRELKTDKGKIVLCHYPFASWNGMRRGAIHLHGHIHSNGTYNLNNLAERKRILDVGVDANEYRPVSLEEVFGMMS